MKKVALFIMVAVFLISTDTMAAPRKPIMVYGFLGESCGKWSAYTETQRAWYLLWLKGFFTGHNFGNQGHQIMSLPDDESMELYFDKYCRDNPLGNLISPTLRLTEELRDKKN
ncbi:MAG: hypothetical protein ACYDIB_04930 [Desulfobulbia bacterium]